MSGNKLTAEINKIETKRTIQRINETELVLGEKINKIDKPLSKLTKRQRFSGFSLIQMNKIRNKKEKRKVSEMIPSDNLLYS